MTKNRKRLIASTGYITAVILTQPGVKAVRIVDRHGRANGVTVEVRRHRRQPFQIVV